jgi:hypothetical protein
MAARFRSDPLGLYSRVEKLTIRHAAAFILVSFILGQVANTLYPLKNLFIYQLLLIPAIIMAFAEVKAFVRGVKEYKIMISSHPTKETGTYALSLLKSCWSLPGLIVISSVYLYSTVTLKYVAFNLTGLYALSMLLLVLLSAILGQTCYVYYLLLLRRVAGSKSFKYNFYFPARTDWVQFLARMGTRLSNAFFILGFIYTAVFFLNVPDDYLTITLSPWRVDVSTPNDPAFVTGWVTIFIIIILAFPMYAWIKVAYMRAIIRKLKDNSLHELDDLISGTTIREQADPDVHLKYHQLMANIENSSNNVGEPLNLLPAALTVSSIAVHLIKISESLSR